MQTGAQGEIPCYPKPEELWALTFAEANAWRDRFAVVPYEDKGGSHPGRYYQDIAIERVMQAIAEERQRILLTLATGTGKTFIAFQIAWKLFHARWNLSREATRRPRILFLADRNILANAIQAGSQPPVNPQEINPQLQQYPPQYAQYPQYQYPPQYAQYPPPQFANPNQPYPYPNVPLPPQYNPHATNPTMMMTEVSMDPLNLGPVQPKTIETFEIVPQCYHKAFMLPFPFFCMGCCMSQTTKF